MASESSYLAIAGAVWGWIKEDISTWARALGNLKAVLEEQDLESNDVIRVALRFSAFSIMIAILVDLPPKWVFVPQSLSLLNIAAVFFWILRNDFLVWNNHKNYVSFS